LICAISIHARPDFFLARHGHVWLGLGQLAAFAIYLLYVVRFYTKLAPLLAEARQEWRGGM
jgi:hypothetical protein